MVHKQRQKLQSIIVDGRLNFPGDERTYINISESTFYARSQSFIPTLRIIAKDPLIRYTIQKIDENVGREMTIDANGTLNDQRLARWGQELCLAGWGDCCSELPVSLTSVFGDQDVTRAVWWASIGFSFVSDDPHLLKHNDQWYCTVSVPEVDLKKLAHAVENGLKEFELALIMNVWIDENDRHMERPMRKQYLVPRFDSPCISVEEARGSLRWLVWPEAGEEARGPKVVGSDT